ncbi:MAG: hypothetical protein QME50_04470 [Candidatus Bathyarchaeota archaeon]|nr:hypothetical protein [Candidatus Bathyarchaeota archaeon]
MLFVASDLDDELIEDLKRQLKEMGYSEEAIAEILKWYNPQNS